MGAYDRLADGIMKHAKAILVVWIVIMICAVPCALKAGDVMSYDTNEMAGEDSESAQGLTVISEYFPSSGASMSSSPILVLCYDNEDAAAQVEAYVQVLNDAIGEGYYVDDDGIEKISTFYYAMSADGEDGSGIAMVLVTYVDGWDDLMSDDTANLRTQMAAVIAAYEEERGDEFALTSYLTGTPAVSYDMMESVMNDISYIDVFSILMILILVGLFFRSFITSVTPPVTIGVAFVVVLALIYGIGQFFNIFFITEVLLIVSMLGAGCDYCIFIIARYREELRAGKDHEHALHDAIKWAGESISVSALAVIIGFGAMSLCSYDLVSMLGICLAIGIIVALLAALTLITSILALVGDRILWPTKAKEYQEGGKATKGWFAACSRLGHRYFEHSVNFSIKHAKAIVIAAIIVTIPCVYVYMTTETSYDMTSSLMAGDSGTGMDLIGEYADEGVIMPDYAVLEFDETIATLSTIDLGDYGTYPVLTWTEDFYSSTTSDSYYYKLLELASSIDEEENISSVTLPFVWTYQVQLLQVEGVTDAETIVETITANAGTTEATVLSSVYTMLAQAAGNDTIAAYLMVYGASFGYDLSGVIDYYVNVSAQLIGGDLQTYENGSSTVYLGNVTYVMLSATTHDAAMSSRSMESISYMKETVDQFVSDNDFIVESWITGTAAVMYDIEDVISGEFTNIEILVIVLIILLLFLVMRSYTIPFRSVLTILMSIVWTLALVMTVFDEVTWLVPLILLVICLGLGMDYDILLTTRIRENVMDKGMSNDDAIRHAVVHSGSVITICGLIMGGAFGTMMISALPMLEQFGLALCFAILVDALVVRTYIVPAVMHLLGDWNWKGPKFLQGRKKDAEPAEEPVEQ